MVSGLLVIQRVRLRVRGRRNWIVQGDLCTPVKEETSCGRGPKVLGCGDPEKDGDPGEKES